MNQKLKANYEARLARLTPGQAYQKTSLVSLERTTEDGREQFDFSATGMAPYLMSELSSWAHTSMKISKEISNKLYFDKSSTHFKSRTTFFHENIVKLHLMMQQK